MRSIPVSAISAWLAASRRLACGTRRPLIPVRINRGPRVKQSQHIEGNNVGRPSNRILEPVHCIALRRPRSLVNRTRPPCEVGHLADLHRCKRCNPARRQEPCLTKPALPARAAVSRQNRRLGRLLHRPVLAAGNFGTMRARNRRMPGAGK